MIKILDVQPTAAVPGGNLFIRWAGRELQPFRRPQVRFGGIPAHLVTVSRDLIVAQVPLEAAIGEMTLSVDRDESLSVDVEIASVLAANLHPVASPAVDSEGNVYTTLSGRR